MAVPRTAGRRRRAPRQEKLGVKYGRFSDEKQGSIAEQAAINDEVAAEAGVRIVASFQDEAMSRTVKDRPGLLEMFAFLEDSPEVGHIVVNELERLTAGVSQRAEITRLCERLDITILTEDSGPINPRDERAMNEADQRAVGASAEVMKVRRRTRRNLRQKILSGTIAMRPAYGTRMKPLVLDDGTVLPSGARYVDAHGRVIRSGVLEVVEEELVWLRKIFDWYVEGVTQEEIARRLTAEGVATKAGRSAWSSSSVRGILYNPLYKGEYVWGHQAVRRTSDGKKYLEVRDEDDPERVVLPSPLGAMVPVDTWEKANARYRSSLDERRGWTQRKKSTHLFDDLVYCGRCGHKMYGGPASSRSRKDGTFSPGWRYTCNSGAPARKSKVGYAPPCKTSHGIREKIMLERLLQRPEAVGPLLVVRGAVAEDDEAVKQALHREIKGLTADLDRATRLALRGLVSEDLLAEQKAKIDTAMRLAQQRLTDLDSSSGRQLPNPAFGTEARESLRRLAIALTGDDASIELGRKWILGLGISRIEVDPPDLSIYFDQ